MKLILFIAIFLIVRKLVILKLSKKIINESKNKNTNKQKRH